MVNVRSYNRSGQGRRHDGWSENVDTNAWNDWDAWESWEKTSNTGRPIGRKWNITWVNATTMKVEQEGHNLADKDMEAWVTNMESEIESRFKGASRELWLNISTLNFSRNQIADAGVNTVVEFLRRRQIGVEKIMLFKNSVSDEGAKAIGQLLMHSPTPVQEVHLSHNNISHEGVRFILEALQQSNRYPYTPERAWAGQKGPLATPLWLRMESNAIDWSNLDDLLEDSVSWCIAQAKDKWHPKNKPPMICMHGSYKMQNHSTPVPPAGAHHAEPDDVDITATTVSDPQSAIADDMVEAFNTTDVSNAKGGKKGAKKGKVEGKGDRKQWKPKEKIVESAHMKKAIELVSNLPDFGDSSVHERWCHHVENADNPDFEAERIQMLCANLNNMGYGFEVPSLNSNGGTGTVFSTDVVGMAEKTFRSKPHLQNYSSSNVNPEADAPLEERMLDGVAGDVSDAVDVTMEPVGEAMDTKKDINANLFQNEISSAENLQTRDTSKGLSPIDRLLHTINNYPGKMDKKMDKSHAVDTRNGRKTGDQVFADQPDLVDTRNELGSEHLFGNQPDLSKAMDVTPSLPTAALVDDATWELPIRKKKGRNKMTLSKVSNDEPVVYQ